MQLYDDLLSTPWFYAVRVWVIFSIGSVVLLVVTENYASRVVGRGDVTVLCAYVLGQFPNLSGLRSQRASNLTGVRSVFPTASHKTTRSIQQ